MRHIRIVDKEWIRKFHTVIQIRLRPRLAQLIFIANTESCEVFYKIFVKVKSKQCHCIAFISPDAYTIFCCKLFHTRWFELLMNFYLALNVAASLRWF